ncbi:hypothetical protein AC1031_020395 [Aphanomyces cochlioides]|nr:hypothetical protein AC1031_020395 [Aphanomyces cochlioides]
MTRSKKHDESQGTKRKHEDEGPRPKKIVRRRVTDLELLYVLEFLEIPSNFAIIVGKAVKGKSVVGGQALTKVQGYKLMVEFINSRVRQEMLQDWDTMNTKGRFESYLRAYKAAHNWESGQTGQGLTDRDFLNGITTSEAKLEDICFGYERMKTLFSDRQNISPSFVAEIGHLENDENRDESHQQIELDENDPTKMR